MAHLKYRPEIDGLRAVSVLGVLFFHADLGFPGGYVGVDVFFVISGYLITSLIMKDRAAGKFSYLNFWERRVRRIFPALTVMVLVTTAVAMTVLLPGDLISYSKSVIAQALLIANVYYWRSSGYFAASADLIPLLHTWSLAVEEQFYFFFPTVLALARFVSNKVLTFFLGGLALVSFVLSVAGTQLFPTATFYLLPMRGWELLIGALVAIAIPPSRLSNRWNSTLTIAGLAGILFAMLAYNSQTTFPGLNAALPCLGVALIVFANSAGVCSAGSLLALAPMVFVGQLSYSLYLWHWPVLVYLRYLTSLELTLSLRIFAIAISFVAAYLSWRFVETPFRNQATVSRPRLMLGAAALTLLLVGLGAAVWQLRGLPARFSPEVVQLASAADSPAILRGIVPLGEPVQSTTKPTFLLWGDSHAMALGELVGKLANEYHLSGYAIAGSARAPLLGAWNGNASRTREETLKSNRSAVDFVIENGIQHVILISRWSCYVEDRPNDALKKFLVDRDDQPANPEVARDVFRRSLENTVQKLREAGVTVWAVTQVPEQHEDIPRLLAIHQHYGKAGAVSSVTRSEHELLQRNVNQIMRDVLGAEHVLDVNEFCFDTQGVSRIQDNGHSLYRDGDHLSQYGADLLVRPALEPVFARIADESPQVSLGKDLRPHGN